MKYKEIILTGAALVLLSSIFFLRPFAVTGGSMDPTYHEGDTLLVETLTTHLHVWRGEVIVLRNPHDHSVTEIKRVVGLPDEDVTLGQGSVTVVHPDGHAETFGPPVGLPQTEFFHIKLGPADYFVLGDNRSKSSDSRTYGAVQAPDIIGHVILTL